MGDVVTEAELPSTPFLDNGERLQAIKIEGHVGAFAYEFDPLQFGAGHGLQACPTNDPQISSLNSESIDTEALSQERGRKLTKEELEKIRTSQNNVVATINAKRFIRLQVSVTAKKQNT